MRVASANLSRQMTDSGAASAECRRDLGELLAREEALIREMEFFHLRTPDPHP
jgi:hypothetical protein